MRKATVTYHAPKGDNKVVEMGGHTFFDGQSVELNTDDDAHLISKLENNPCFDFDLGPDDGQTQKKRGRPSNADKAAAAAKADLTANTAPAPASKPEPIVPPAASPSKSAS